MDRAGHRVVAQHVDHPLDLPPAAEVDEIAHGAAAVGAARRLRARMLSEPVDKRGRVGQGFPAGKVDLMTQFFPRSFCLGGVSRATLSKPPNGEG
jgi:hypothetical protein